MLRRIVHIVPFVYSLIILSCQKELHFDTQTQPQPGSKNQWEFSENQILYGGKVDSAFLGTGIGAQSLTLYGTSSDRRDKYFLQLVVPGTLSPGNFKGNVIEFIYSRGGSKLYRNGSPYLDEFSITITYLSADSVNGTFRGTAIDASGKPKNILNGIFASPLVSRQSNIGDTTSGQLVLWARQGCGASATDPMKTKVENQEGRISSFYAAEPGCNTNGIASFILPEGNYTAYAICGSDTTTIGVTVIKGACTKAEVGSCNGPLSGCRVNVDTLFFPPAQELSARIYFFNTFKQVEKIQKVNLLNSEVLNELRLTYTSTQIKINNDDYFNLDGCGRVREYRGTDIPGAGQQLRLFARFYYNGAGYMERITYADANTPAIVNQEIALSWANGNLMSAVWKELGTLAKIEYAFQYDLALQVKNFACFIPSNPIFYLQSALNYGKNSANPINKITVRTTNQGGQQSTEETFYTAYETDPNNYVTYFVVSGSGNHFFSVGTHFLGYKCF